MAHDRESVDSLPQSAHEGILTALAADERLAVLVLRFVEKRAVVDAVVPGLGLFRTAQLVGQELAAALSEFGDDCAHVLEAVQRVREARVPESCELEGEVQGQHRVATLTIAATRRTDGGDGVTILLTDRSHEQEVLADRDRMQERAAVVGQLEVVGRLAAGVAHDFNNVLTAVIGNTALLRMVLERSGGLTVRAEHIVEEIERASDRASALVRQLLTYTNQRPIEPAGYRIGELLESAYLTIERLLPASVEVSVCVLDPSAVLIDRVLFEQTIVSLALNASDAMERGGLLTLTARAAGPDVLIEVTDTGVGMTDDVAAQMFEPFFTTKPPGKGTGLGLVNVKRTIEQAGGSVVADSTPGVGTTMRLRLPAVEPPPEAHSGGSGATRMVGGQERIFLCEDDDIVRQSVVGMLELAGYRVMSANGPVEALHILGQTEEPYDLVISDIIMPTMNGVELAKAVRTTQPDMPILFISGYSSDVLVDQGVHAAEVDLLQKPFDYATLVKRVKRALRATRTRL